jgi:hypothetical protein
MVCLWVGWWLPGGQTESPGPTSNLCPSRLPPSPLRASSRPCLWQWTSSLKRKRSFQLMFDSRCPSWLSVTTSCGSCLSQGSRNPSKPPRSATRRQAASFVKRRAILVLCYVHIGRHAACLQCLKDSTSSVCSYIKKSKCFQPIRHRMSTRCV